MWDASLRQKGLSARPRPSSPQGGPRTLLRSFALRLAHDAPPRPAAAATEKQTPPPPAARSQQVRAESTDAVTINPSIKKDVDKVVDTFKAADLPKKAVFCRCWRSGKFPMCDGTHAKHNAATGDNVGPLIVDLS
jgi:CDGSH iron-sulfur domain-containing protein 2